jgi:hypothetical protein
MLASQIHTSHTSIPAVFEPRHLRSGIQFKDLSRHVFQPQEMLWLCEVMRGVHGGWSIPSYHIHTPQALARRYGLPVRGLRYWIKLYDDQVAFDDMRPMRCEPADESILDRYSMRAVHRWRAQHLSESEGDGR